jgi:hypothetical protein
VNLSSQAAPDTRRFQCHKQSQLFIRSHNETLSVAAMCVSNEDRSPVSINGVHAAPAPTGWMKAAKDSNPDPARAKLKQRAASRLTITLTAILGFYSASTGAGYFLGKATSSDDLG